MEMLQNLKSVTLLQANTDQLLSVHIITEFSAVMTNDLPETCRGLYVRLGRSVIGYETREEQRLTEAIALSGLQPQGEPSPCNPWAGERQAVHVDILICFCGN